jgi:flagellar biosynthesis chaperone FliJ
MKRRFDFRLERLKRVRKIEERVARAEWGRTEALAQAQEALRARRARELDDSRRELAAGMLPGSTLRPEWMLHTEHAFRSQVASLRLAHEDALTRRAQADAFGRVWRERKLDHRALEELEGRARTRHRAEVERWDNAQLDEQAVLRAARRQPGRDHEGREEDSSSTVPTADEPLR